MPSTLYYGFDAAGSAYPYADYAAADAAASAGDTIIAGYANNKRSTQWWGVVAPSKNITLEGLLSNQRIVIAYGSGGGYVLAPTANCTFQNLTFFTGQKYVLGVGAGLTITVNRCRSVGDLGHYLTTGGTLYINSCLLEGGGYGIANFGGNVYAKNVTVMNNLYAFSNFGTVCECINCASIYSRSGWDGSGHTGSNNASEDGTAPGTGAVNVFTSDPKMWQDISASFGSHDPRITMASALVGAGVATANTLDLFGRVFAATPAIGCCEGWDIPTELAAGFVIAGNDFIILDGTTRTATYVPPAPAATTLPTLTVADLGAGVARFTISGSDLGASNRIYARLANATAWPGLPTVTIVGDGAVNATLTPGSYLAKVQSDLVGVVAPADNEPVIFFLADAQAGYTRSEFGETFQADAIPALFASFGEPVGYRRGVQYVTLNGIQGEAVTANDPNTGIDVVVGDASWEVSADDLDFGAGPIVPKAQDQIITAKDEIYVVVEAGVLDAEQLIWTIPVKRSDYKEIP